MKVDYKVFVKSDHFLVCVLDSSWRCPFLRTAGLGITRAQKICLLSQTCSGLHDCWVLTRIIVGSILCYELMIIFVKLVFFVILTSINNEVVKRALQLFHSFAALLPSLSLSLFQSLLSRLYVLTWCNPILHLKLSVLLIVRFVIICWPTTNSLRV